MYSMSDAELLRLYAKLNAQDVLINSCLRAILRSDRDPAAAFEMIRAEALKIVKDRKVAENDPNPEFAESGRVATLLMVDEAFESLRKAIAPEDQI